VGGIGGVLHDGDAAVLPDHFQPRRPVGIGARQHDAHHAAAVSRSGRLEKDVDGRRCRFTLGPLAKMILPSLKSICRFGGAT